MIETRIPVYPVLLAGGMGTRLWPVSRKGFPKQFARFTGGDSLIQATVRRMSPALDLSRLRVVCGADQAFHVQKDLAELGIDPDACIIREPCGRNTAPAILLGVSEILAAEEDAVICIFPADHAISDTASFHGSLEQAVKAALTERIVTFGIRPTYPETGYGYIEGGVELGGGAFSVKRFVEKPDEETAQEYLEAGNFYWNSGMFAFLGSVMRKEFAHHMPGMLSEMERLRESGTAGTVEGYSRLENISIDFAIMEKTDQCAVIPSDFGWSDIGSFKSLHNFMRRDAEGNVFSGDVLSRNAIGCLVMGSDRLITVNDVSGLCIVDTPDALFVSNLSTSREVKLLVRQMAQKQRSELLRHQKAAFPWGTAEKLCDAKDGSAVKLVIAPGAVPALPPAPDKGIQAMGCHGEATLAMDDAEFTLSPGAVSEIPEGLSGRMANPGEAPCIVMLVFTGSLGGWWDCLVEIS